MSQPQQQQVSDEPLEIGEVSAIHQLLVIAFGKGAYSINDAGVIDVVNKRMVAILTRADKERAEKNAPSPLREKSTKVKKEAKGSKKLKPVVAAVKPEESASEVDSDDEVPEPTRIQ
jgi:hypothetical protein